MPPTLSERINRLQVRIEEKNSNIQALEKECRHFHRQFEILIDHVKRSDALLQNQELRIYELGKAVKELDKNLKAMEKAGRDDGK